jgi:uncharacterized OB-fold protein
LRQGWRRVNVAYNSDDYRAKCAHTQQASKAVTQSKPTESMQAYQQALQQGRFLIQQCRDCGMHVHPPREQCSHCDAPELKWIEPTGRATVQAVRLVQRALDAGGDYALADIMLEEGPLLQSRVMDVAPEKVAVGMPVSAHVGLLEGELGVVFYNKEQGSREW